MSFSSNKGTNWSTPVFAQDISVVGVVSPDSGQALRDASILYAVSANPKTGALYLTWQDDRFTTATCTTPTGTIPIDGIAFSQSLDGGVTWSTPIMVNQTPANTTNPCRQQAFIPAVVATGDGKAVVVTYYDFRNDTNTPTGFEGTDYFAVICTVRKRLFQGHELGRRTAADDRPLQHPRRARGRGPFSWRLYGLGGERTDDGLSGVRHRDGSEHDGGVHPLDFRAALIGVRNFRLERKCGRYATSALSGSAPVALGATHGAPLEVVPLWSAVDQ